MQKPTLDTIPKNYRPVSNLSFISKVLEEAICLQLNSHISLHNLEERYQSAYRKSHSTETALLRLFNNLLIHLDNRKAVLLTMLDLSAAFDTVDHSIYLRRIHNAFGVQNGALDWLSSYLSDRRAQVKIDNALSDFIVLDCALPQGSKIGPRGYSQYTKPLGAVVKSHEMDYHFYADDSGLENSFNPRSTADQNEALSKAANCVCDISTWMKANKLKLNRDKTEFLIVTSQRNEHHIVLDSLRLGEDCVKRSSVARVLGILIDSYLTLESHISSTVRTCNYFLRWIRDIRYRLTEDAAKALVHAMVISRLDYCNCLFVNLPKRLINRLQRVLNQCARVVRPSGEESTMDKLKSLHWLPIEQRITFKVALITHKALHGAAPDYISDMLRVYAPARSLRSSDCHLLCENRPKQRYGERAFQNASPKIWNALPITIRREKDLLTFRKLLKTHLFRNAYHN